MDRKERIILLLLTVLNFTHILDFMIMMPLGNYLMPYFDISSQQFSMLVAAYTFSAGASGFLAAFFVDGFDRKKVLIVCLRGIFDRDFVLRDFACLRDSARVENRRGLVRRTHRRAGFVHRRRHHSV